MNNVYSVINYRFRSVIRLGKPTKINLNRVVPNSGESSLITVCNMYVYKSEVRSIY